MVVVVLTKDVSDPSETRTKHLTLGMPQTLGVSETDSDRQSETDNHRQRQTETDRDRERQTETDRDRERQTNRQTETDRDRQRQADTHIHTQTDTDRDRQRQTDSTHVKWFNRKIVIWP